jgi:hypothetical protein
MGLDYSSADPLGNGGQDCVSKGGNSVHPMGNPCKCSSHSGLIGPPAWLWQSSDFSAWPEYPRLWAVALGDGISFAFPCLTTFARDDLPCRAVPLWSLLRGVGSNENPFPLMGRTNGTRWKSNPFRIKPQLGKASKHVSHSGAKQAWRVFHQDIAGS